jgi:methylated-DNA-[protein]-cysteine S-methyltransferase
VAPRRPPIRRALQRYFAGKLQAIDEIPVQTGGTPFQGNVWRALRRIRRARP